MQALRGMAMGGPLVTTMLDGKSCNGRTFATKQCRVFQMLPPVAQPAALPQHVKPRPRPRRPVAHVTVQPVPLRMALHECLGVKRSAAGMTPARGERHLACHFAV